MSHISFTRFPAGLWGQSGKSVVTAVTQSHLYPQHLCATWVPHYSSAQSQWHTSQAGSVKLANAGMCRTKADRNPCLRGCENETVLQKTEDLRISDIKRSQQPPQSEMHLTWDVWGQWTVDFTQAGENTSETREFHNEKGPVLSLQWEICVSASFQFLMVTFITRYDPIQLP